MHRLRRLVREPLVHFVLVGGAVFCAWLLVKGDDYSAGEETTIVVDRRSLLAFMQYRASAFEPDVFAAALDSMSPAELDRLIAAYVDDEIMYRQAEELGLGESDYVIRQRMIQKADFLLGDAASAGIQLDDAKLRAYFEANRDAYATEPSLTFTHVFFDVDRRGESAAHAAAKESAQTLTAAGEQFADATRHGDRFPFLTNYVERTPDYVASHFGTDFADAISTLTPSASKWQGPIRSAYGEHVVLLTERTPSRYPEFDTVREAVERDYVDAHSRADRARMLDGLRNRYRVRVEPLSSR
jgi:hypothetical protein